MISRPTAFASAMSVPTSRPSHRSAHCADGGAARVDDDELRAAMHSLQHVVEEDRMRLAGIRAPEHDQVRTLAQLLVGACPAACTEHRRQTDDARSVSGAVAAIDVVRVQGETRELLSGEVQLVRGLGAAEETGHRAPVVARCESRPRRDRAPRPSLRSSALRSHGRAVRSAWCNAEAWFEYRRVCGAPGRRWFTL